MEQYVSVSADEHFERLTAILEVCKSRISRDNVQDDWINLFAKQKYNMHGGFNSALFKTYIDALIDDGYVKLLRTDHGARDYIATLKGLSFVGFKETQKREYYKNLRVKVESLAVIIGGIIAILYLLYKVFIHLSDWYYCN